MVFSDTTNSLGLIQDITFITGAGLSQYEIEDRTRNINNWYLQVASWIFEADGRWQWDDANQTDRPCATTNLVKDQKGYGILSASPSAGKDWLEIERVEITDENGEEREIRPIDQTDLEGIALDEFMDSSGKPEYFDFRGGSVYLYPASNYNKDDSLTIYFKRSPLVFSSTDTTKTPGFATPFHKLLSLGASYDWALAKGDTNVDRIRQEIEVLKQNLKNFYSKRSKYERPKLTHKYTNFK